MDSTTDKSLHHALSNDLNHLPNETTARRQIAATPRLLHLLVAILSNLQVVLAQRQRWRGCCGDGFTLPRVASRSRRCARTPFNRTHSARPHSHCSTTPRCHARAQHIQRQRRDHTLPRSPDTSLPHHECLVSWQRRATYPLYTLIPRAAEKRTRFAQVRSPHV